MDIAVYGSSTEYLPSDTYMSSILQTGTAEVSKRLKTIPK
jgi:hypothetical protein